MLKSFVAMALVALCITPLHAGSPDSYTLGGADRSWTAMYAPDVPYYNQAAGAVNVHSGPGITYTDTGSIGPGEGGYIRECNIDGSWCRIDYGGLGASGWVRMSFFSGFAN